MSSARQTRRRSARLTRETETDAGTDSRSHLKQEVIEDSGVEPDTAVAADEETTSSKSSATAASAVSTGMSQYEAERLKTMQENAAFLATLGIAELTPKPPQIEKTKPKSKSKRKSLPANQEYDLLPKRSSRRIKGLDVDGTPLPEDPAVEQETRPSQILGDVEYISCVDDVADSEDDSGSALLKEFLAGMNDKDGKASKAHKANVKALTLKDWSHARILRTRITSVAFLPSATNVVAMVGDKSGGVGLFNLTASCKQSIARDNDDESAWTTASFHPFLSNVSAIHPDASSTNNGRALLSGYEGVVRCFDSERSAFTEVMVYPEDNMLASTAVCFNTHALVGCHADGRLSFGDLRAGKAPHEWIQCHDRKIAHGQINPQRHHILVTTSLDQSVKLWDLRMIKPKRSKSTAATPLSKGSHGKSVSSAAFSPLTGNLLVTSSLDNSFRLWDVSSDTLEQRQRIAHNNQTGRWVSHIKPSWDPKSEDYFVCGSMDRPRKLQIYDVSSGVETWYLRDEELQSIAPLTACHPSLNMICGANSSGRVYAFVDKNLTLE
eukprot:m.352802 g.352802  ORF g.352802 m.352802 type:complete len:552 (+) comp16615_c0_seq1:299-1954(+)